MSLPFREMLDSWSSLYSNSAVIRSAVAFAHTGGLVLGGGSAIANDLGTLRVLRRSPDAIQTELERLQRVHPLVISSLAVVILSGVLLMAADFDAYVVSRAFWIKMACVAALLLNGAVLARLGSRALGGQPRPLRWLKPTAYASLVLWTLTTLMGTVIPNAL